ncbi:ethanolamine utilization protein [Paenibacillus dendritiformis C454]|uniref:Ethanolamine utilization protein n=1 Tax=Paenibacillus dendritiformis C454 TaxID=1131935 RepID=H3SFQ9_9BACL|nr:ethanolamine utilization protein [Paenibacillus dendritiformis C454]
MVEVRGYLGAIAAADAALKAASVTCIGAEIVKGGLVTVKLSGDVGAVQAAVEAGAEAAKQLNVLLTRHVIARLHEETAAMVAGPVDADANEPQAGEAAPAGDEAPAGEKVAATSSAAEEAAEAPPAAEPAEAKAEVNAAAPAGETAAASKAEAAVQPDSGRTGSMSAPAAKAEAPAPAAEMKASAQPSRSDAQSPRTEPAVAPAAKRAKKTKKATS